MKETLKFFATLIGLFMVIFHIGLLIAVVVQADLSLFTMVCDGRNVWACLSGVISFIITLTKTVS